MLPTGLDNLRHHSLPPLLTLSLRHTHATELVNDGVSLTTIRKRLGHKNLQTTLRYAEQSDAAADAELRAWRRHQEQGRQGRGRG